MCEKGCGLKVPLDELPDHNCVQELHKVINESESRYKDWKIGYKNSQGYCLENDTGIGIHDCSIRVK